MNTTPLTLSTELVPFMEEFTTPAWVEAEGQRFTFDQEQGCYMNEAGEVLMLEPVMSDGTLTEDAYYELP